MDTGATGPRRYGRIGTTPAVGRIAGGKATEIAPTEAVAASGSATQSDNESLHHDDGRGRRPGERYELAAETRQTLLQAVDAGSGEVLWQIPGDVLPRLYREVRRAAAGPGPASFAPDTAQALAVEVAADSSVTRRLGTRAYAHEDDDPPPSGAISRTV
jgi:hypothetical protein